MNIKEYFGLMRNGSDRAVLKRIIDLGGKLEVLSAEDELLKAFYKGRVRYVLNNKLYLDKKADVNKAINKNVTKIIIKESGLNVPRGFSARTFGEARALIKEKGIAFPVIIKPIEGTYSQGVFLDIENLIELKSKIGLLKKDFKNLLGEKGLFMIEERVVGIDYRILVLEGEVLSCIEKKTAHVCGDGSSSIKQLIEDRNSKKIISSHKIVIDSETVDLLKEQGFDLESVPAKGLEVRLKKIASISTGGDSIDRTDIMSDFFRRIAIRTANALNLRRCGIDIMTDDITSGKAKNYWIIEVNSNPGLTFHEKPIVIGKGRNVMEKVIDAFFGL